MYCENCGKEIKDGEKFCMFCGAKIDEPEHDILRYDLEDLNAQNESFSGKNRSKKKNGAVIWIIVLIVAVVVVLALMFGRKETVMTATEAATAAAAYEEIPETETEKETEAVVPDHMQVLMSYLDILHENKDRIRNFEQKTDGGQNGVVIENVCGDEQPEMLIIAGAGVPELPSGVDINFYAGKGNTVKSWKILENHDSAPGSGYCLFQPEGSDDICLFTVSGENDLKEHITHYIMMDDEMTPVDEADGAYNVKTFGKGEGEVFSHNGNSIDAEKYNSVWHYYMDNIGKMLSCDHGFEDYAARYGIETDSPSAISFDDAVGYLEEEITTGMPEAAAVMEEEETSDTYREPETATETMAPETEPEKVQRYADVRNFYIEGKWKNTGSTGFGQAQPGSIIIFDGMNCNYFSPRDTYAFYKNGNNWQLDCTSFMSTDTLSFTVGIIDENNIEIIYGSKAVKLTRVG
ncbi:MAG: zinc ribbon domain-containing protein [Eubacteriales bacterium]|nr:zinc ribbon domain-containing protein [Eubacteriales bacterium]